MFWQKGPGVSIVSKALGPTPDKFNEIPSDHRPVIANITFDLKSSSYPALKRLVGVVQAVFAFFRGILASIFSGIGSLFFSSSNTAAFDAHFKDDVNYTYLKQSPYFGLLLEADITPADLEGYFNGLGKTLPALLEAKNSHHSYKDTDAQICEFFIVWCALKKLNREKVAEFNSFEIIPKNLLSQLKLKMQRLGSNLPQEAKVQRYFNEKMKESWLHKSIAQERSI